MFRKVIYSHIHLVNTCKAPTMSGASLVAQLVKNPPAIHETPVRFLGQEDPLKKG